MSAEIEKYLQINAEIERSYKQALRNKRQQTRAGKDARLDTAYFRFALVGPSVLAIPLTIIGKWAQAYWLYNVSAGLIAVSYLAMFFYPLLGVLLYRHSLKKAITAPFANLLELNVKTLMQVEARYLPDLAALSRETLKLGALELKSERDSLEKRTHMVTGALEKVGTLPGLLALIVALSSLDDMLVRVGIAERTEWLLAIAATNTFFFVMCCYVQFMIVRYERMIALTELAVDCKDRQTT
ncbi:hypothetical protein IFR08_07380 [Pseudomonas fluorescens]|uniref:hypothetical protein n=1 Tax=Pseudomonas fluorescens TaxID=294 RepID=UPI00177B45CD|nr:hypothetical protein [Pseudomonas fluorescens]MBD8097999.1 hypothetical protein [Pseudomonas fluorescens]MBD8773590.1 hypothetical protein [Pseudomonas fluorescens]MBD8782210.1 hypothetical protein [Pseudomonas fluorescens]MBD8793895.1 hypothetical protein [Pseudomonas fluorescens]